AIVRAGGQVIVRAWAIASEGALLRYFWTVEAGRVAGQGTEVSWDLTGVQQNPFPYTATVRVIGPGGMTTDCTLRVFVASPEYGTEGGLRSGREVGRRWLLPDQIEAEGYGLYSYLLFGAMPEGEAPNSYLEAIKAYFRLIPHLEALEKYFKPGELNVMYLPIQKLPPDIQAVTPEWVLAHYDYTRARYLMRALPGSNRAGPYLVSTLLPLGQTSRLPEQHLFQDLSAVPPDLVSLWVREFLNQAAQQDFSHEGTAAKLVLQLRTTIARLAIALPAVETALRRLGLPDIGTAVKTWIVWSPAG
ncbi:MAG: hypothetical protein ACREOH_19135, partial [Candidatus Entotheonellia bacterium]